MRKVVFRTNWDIRIGCCETGLIPAFWSQGRRIKVSRPCIKRERKEERKEGREEETERERERAASQHSETDFQG